MKENPFRLRQRGFAHVLSLVLMPAGVHALFTLFFGLEADTAGALLLSSVASALAVGAFLFKWGYGPVESSLAAAWPSVLAVWRHWHWALGMPSPGGSAQSLARFCGWADASMPEAVAAVLIPFGAVGWLFMLFDRWYERKTGHSLFEAE